MRYAWSSAAAHLRGIDDRLVKVAPLLELVNEWASYLSGGVKEHEAAGHQRGERTRRPLEREGFIDNLEE